MSDVRGYHLLLIFCMFGMWLRSFFSGNFKFCLKSYLCSLTLQLVFIYCIKSAIFCILPDIFQYLKVLPGIFQLLKVLPDIFYTFTWYFKTFYLMFSSLWHLPTNLFTRLFPTQSKCSYTHVAQKPESPLICSWLEVLVARAPEKATKSVGQTTALARGNLLVVSNPLELERFFPPSVRSV